MTANTSAEKSDPTVLLVIQNFSEKKKSPQGYISRQA